MTTIPSNIHPHLYNFYNAFTADEVVVVPSKATSFRQNFNLIMLAQRQQPPWAGKPKIKSGFAPALMSFPPSILSLMWCDAVKNIRCRPERYRRLVSISAQNHVIFINFSTAITVVPWLFKNNPVSITRSVFEYRVNVVLHSIQQKKKKSIKLLGLNNHVMRVRFWSILSKWDSVLELLALCSFSCWNTRWVLRETNSDLSNNTMIPTENNRPRSFHCLT